MTPTAILLARRVAECADFRSNEAHAGFASALSVDFASQTRADFVMACMPSWMVGTSKANMWERKARAVGNVRV